MLFLTIDTYVKEGPGAVYAAAVTPLQIVQTAALLEVKEGRDYSVLKYFDS